MVISKARVPTSRADRYANRLCKHFAHKIHAEWTPPEGVAEFPEFGTCRLIAQPDELLLRIEVPDPDKLSKVQDIVGGHLERFGARDNLTVKWTEKGESNSQ